MPAAYVARHALAVEQARDAAHVWHLKHLAHLRKLAYDARHRAVPQSAAAHRAPRATGGTGAAPAVAARSVSRTSHGSPQATAAAMLSAYGWSPAQMPCLVELWNKESHWDAFAENAASGAYGIPQALPASKMASAGPDWRTNAATQVRWGLEYIEETYGSPCGAWSHSVATGWY